MSTVRDKLESLKSFALSGKADKIDTMFFILGLVIAETLIEISENIADASLHKPNPAGSNKG